MLSDAPTGVPAYALPDLRDERRDTSASPVVSNAGRRCAKYDASAGSSRARSAAMRSTTCSTVAGEYHWCGLPPTLHADQLADVEHDATRLGVGVEQLLRPRVVADAVHDHVDRPVATRRASCGVGS